MVKIYDITSLDSLRKTVRELKDFFIAPSVIGLTGDLGAGKTTFVAELCSQLGLSRNEIVSPTYILRNEYIIGNLLIEHWDLYRCKVIPEELLAPLAGNCLRLIEWADLLPAEYRPQIMLTFVIDKYGRRNLELRTA